MVNDMIPSEFMTLDKKEVKEYRKREGIEVKPQSIETIEKKGKKEFIKTEGKTFDELTENLEGFDEDSYINEDETKQNIRTKHNLRETYLWLARKEKKEKRPVMVKDAKEKINVSAKSSLYALFHRLREMGLVRNISIMNIFFEGSKYSTEKDFVKDDMRKFNDNEKKIIIKNFRKRFGGVENAKQKQTYIAGSYYWALSEKGKRPDFLRFAINMQNLYKEKEREEMNEK